MKIEMINLLQDLIYVIMVAVIPVLTVYAVKMIKAIEETMHSYTTKIDEENEKIKLDRLHYYIKKASDMIEDTVDTVSQVFVKELKEHGKFDQDAKDEAFAKAYNTAKSMLTSDMEEAIKTLYADVDSYVGIKIESLVNRNNKSKDEVNENETVNE